MDLQHSLRTNGELVTDDGILKVKNFKQWVDPYVKRSVQGISKTRFATFESGRPIQFRETMTGQCTDMPLYKVGMNRKIIKINLRTLHTWLTWLSQGILNSTREPSLASRM